MRRAIVLVLLVAAAAASASGANGRPAGIHLIRHVVVIMQENRSFDSYFGTYPGADGIPQGTCVPDPRTESCLQPYHDTADRNAGGPHDHVDAVARHRRREDGRLRRTGGVRTPARMHGARRRADVLARAEGARRHGLPRLARDPELLVVRAPLRPAGPHVPARPLVEPAGAPVHGLRLVGDVRDEGRPDELPRGGAGAGLAAGRAAEHDGRRSRLRLDRSHVPLAQGARELALLRREGKPAGLRRQRDVLRAGSAEREDAGHLEPAAVLRHGAATTVSCRTSRRFRTSSARRGGERCLRCRGSRPRRP